MGRTKLIRREAERRSTAMDAIRAEQLEDPLSSSKLPAREPLRPICLDLGGRIRLCAVTVAAVYLLRLRAAALALRGGDSRRGIRSIPIRSHLYRAPLQLPSDIVFKLTH